MRAACWLSIQGRAGGYHGASPGQGGHWRAWHSQPVFVLDPFHIVPGFVSASYNVFDEMESVAKYDATARQLRPQDRPGSGPEHQPRSLLGRCAPDFHLGAALYIFQGRKNNRNLVRLRELIMEGDKQVYAQVIRAGGDKRGDAFDALLTMMKQCPEGPYRHVIVGSANSLSKMSPNQRGSVLTMTMEHTSFPRHAGNSGRS